MNYIYRKEYMDFLIRNKDRQIIKVVSGIRRCGKSTIFEMYREYLLNSGVSPEQLINIYGSNHAHAVEGYHVKELVQICEMLDVEAIVLE